jgi:hypothetical protein
MLWVLRALVGALVGLSACVSAREPSADGSITGHVKDAGPLPTGEVHIRVLDAASGEPVRCKLLLTAAGKRLAIGPPGMVGAWLDPHTLAGDLAVYGDPCDMTLQLPAEEVQLQASAGIEWDIAQATLTPRAAARAEVELKLNRALDTSGYA